MRIAAGDAVVDVEPAVGGAVAGFTLGGHPILRPASGESLATGDVLGFASYPLVPYSNRLAQATLVADGRRHALAPNFGTSPHAIHGIGWQRAWRVVDAREDSIGLAFAHEPTGARARDWPFAFRAWQALQLTATARGACLRATIGIESLDARPQPFGLGFHPFFPRSRDTVLGFRARAVWITDDTGIPTTRSAIPPEWSFDPPRAIGETVVDNAFAQWAGEATIHTPGFPWRIELAADSALRHLVVYVPAGGDCLAVEPVTHMTDAFNRSARGEAGTGTRVLPPGQSFSCTMRINAVPAP